MKIGYNVKPLLAAGLLLKGMDREVSTQINKATKIMIGPAWKQAVTEHAQTRQEQSILARTAKVDVKNYGVIVRAGGGTKRLRGGLPNNALARQVEFGSLRRPVKVGASRRARAYTRRMGAQLPYRRREGPFYKAVADVAPRLAALWAQTTVRSFWEVFK
ncbi:hypothetical protein GCM10027515_26570 [Schumannella luteola]|uniref:HK97 gp10 family phage protein n=1 Tax=Schumannella luteola TaxID=472059 RepID=A0A852Y9A6_9MICO|nr:hypothetical protein [Schumannella luteola]NYG99546.1 hypothetical protein [Schumannella luteola]TPX03863.1 hypothetical protein FJ656_15135 [Schumannella luteola]